MSKCCCCRRGYGAVSPYATSPYGVSPYGPAAPAPARGGLLGGLGAGCGCGSTYGGCNFACFIILILILLTFTNNRNSCGCNEIATDGCCNNDNFGGIGKGILFVIALYYLSCWVPCARGGGNY